MPTIRRDDGVQFVIQSYREQFSSNKISALKREIRLLAKNHGEYIRCYRQPTGQMEVVFSREPGYLLGETVWNYFKKPLDMIYCEALPDKQHALLVIVRSGNVYLDTKALFTSLIDEFIALAMNQEQYVIYVYGEVPLHDRKIEGAFVFDTNRVKEFNRLTDPVFPKLELYTIYQLQPLELALTSSEFARPIIWPVIFLSVGILGVILVWHYLETSTKVRQVNEVIAKSPYEDYSAALATPSPKYLIQELISVIDKTYALPGWRFTDIDYSNDQYKVIMEAVGGESRYLKNWASSNNFSANLSEKSATISIASKIPNRQPPKYIYRLNFAKEKLIKKIAPVITKNQIIVGATTNEGNIFSMKMTINFNEISPTILSLIGNLLAGYPLQLLSISIDAKDNLLTGNIQLILWGD